MNAQEISDDDLPVEWAFVKDKDGYETTETAVASIAAFSDCVSYIWEHKWQKARKLLAKKYFQYTEEEFPWFRGICNKNYELMPCIYWKFKDKSAKQIANIAEDIREEFKRRGKYFQNQQYRNWEEGEWYQLMQHYTAPTRLLDWTEGALIALYFAVRKQVFSEKPARKTAPCVWMLNPSWLNDISIGTSLPVYLTESAMRDYRDTDAKARPYLSEEKLPKYPIAIYPVYNDAKFPAQKSVFTIHGKSLDGFRELSLLDKNAMLCKILINPDNIAAIAKELRRLGITESTVFPDLKGLANEIRNEKGITFSFDR